MRALRPHTDDADVPHREQASNWGRAEDGGIVVVRLPSGERLPDGVWPPLGLTAVGPAAAADREIVVEPDPTSGVQVLLDGMPAAGGWDRVESELGLFAAERLHTLVAVHAAVVVSDGRAVLLPGPSMAGKTSLCVAARDVGLDVLTDEFALLDPATGLVGGWPRRFRIRTEEGPVRIDGVSSDGRFPVGLVAALRHDPYRTGSLDVEDITPGQTVLHLLRNTVCARSRPVTSFSTALVVARSASGVQGRRGEAIAALGPLLDLLHRRR